MKPLRDKMTLRAPPVCITVVIITYVSIACVLLAMCGFSKADLNATSGTVEARQSISQRQAYFLDVLSGKNVQANDDDAAGFDDRDTTIDPEKIAEINRLVGRRDIYQGVRPRHQEALHKCITLLRERDNWRNILIRASKLRDQINIQLWINAVVASTVYSPAMAGLYKPALIELSPDRYLPYQVIERAVNESGSGQRQGGTCTKLDETTGTGNGIENALWYFREDIQLNAQHWYWHIAYPAFPDFPLPPRPDRRGELFYFFHQSMLARYTSERLSNNLQPTISLSAATANEVVQEGYITYLTDINSNTNYGSRPPNQPISYASNQPFLTNVYNAIDSNTLKRTNGQNIPLLNRQGIDFIGDIVENSLYTINQGLYGGVHNNGHVLIALLTNPTGVMGDTATSMRDIVFYRWHGFINDIFERHKAFLSEYSATGGDVPLVWAGVQVTSIQVNSGSSASTNNLRTFWSQRSFDISRGLDLLRPAPTNSPIPVCIKHLNHDPFTYTINIAKQSQGSQRASIRIYLAPRYNTAGTRFSMEEQRKLIFILDTFSATLNTGNNVIQRDSSASTVTKPWSKTFQELENDNSLSTPQCGCGWPEHLLIPKGKESGMVFDLFVLVTNGVEDSAGPFGEQSGTCSQPYHYCGIRGQAYPDRKPMGFPFDRRSPFLSPGRRVANLDEFVGLVPNSKTVQVTITHVNQIL